MIFGALICVGPWTLVQANGTPGGFGAPTVEDAAPHDHSGEPHAHEHAHERGDPAQGLQVVLVPSELIVGTNRFAVGLFDAEGRHVSDATVHLHYFDLRHSAAPQLESEADAYALSTPDGFTTIFAHERRFEWEGAWGVEVQATLPGERYAVARIAFQVLEEPVALAPGDTVPSLATPTLSEAGGDLTHLSSAFDPNPALYRVSLSEAIENGKPTVILFATPGFCRTRLCGPSYATVSELQERYGHDANFIHLEIFDGLPNPADSNWQLAPHVRAFGLQTEPWLYIVDPSGAITYRVEGLFTTSEIEERLDAMLHP